MPRRIHSQIVPNSLLPCRSSSSPASSSGIAFSSPSCGLLHNLSYSRPFASPLPANSQTSRPFSSTQTAQTRLRQDMFAWLSSEGAEFKNHVPGSTNYISDVKARAKYPDMVLRGPSRPFPLNPNFVSESVLSEELRNEIYERVVVKKQSVRAVSVEMGVDMRRVAAVCRLVEMEKRWRQQGKPLALPYARAVHEMIPTTPLYEKPSDQRNNPHESINDLPVHRLTDAQIFYPVSESRHFTRVDASRVFSAAPATTREQDAKQAADPSEIVNNINRHSSSIETVGKGDEEQPILQSADVRIPHPYLIAHERRRMANPQEHRENRKAYEERLKEVEAAEEEHKRYARERRERRLTRVQPEDSRFEFRIKDVVVSKETTGPDGRGARAPGRRYGVPSSDRKKGQVKIPTKVEV
ncbi:mitochondrial 37S ribosomal protein mS45 [Aspergillus lucknowensis]|uniref:Eukaryotic mitochondrial regulator protein-domain-containing protein n=1 Tax=Aspergillus lucknowensis TaxID=176173 RepID=A0ABR4LUG4_9EURO